MKPEELNQHIQDLLDGDIQADALEQLEAELATKPEAIQQYLAYADLNNLLELEHEVRAQQSPGVVPIDRIMQRQKTRSLRTALLSAAAILVIVIIALSLFFSQDKGPTLAFQTSPGTLFTLSHDQRGEEPDGKQLKPGSRLQLSQGAVELTFRTGVKSIIQAPADLTLHDDNHLYLAEGTAWFQVAKGAEGFTVDTADLHIVDLGTEFGVRAHPNDHDELHVLSGKVEVSAKRVRKQSLTLHGGQSCRIDPVGRLLNIPTQPDHFLTSLPDSLPYLHWSFDKKENMLIHVEDKLSPDQSIKTIMVHQGKDASKGSVTSTTGKFGNAISNQGNHSYLEANWMGISDNAPRTIAYWLKIPPHENYYHPIVGWGDRIGSPLHAGGSCFSYIRSRNNNKTVIGFNLTPGWLEGSTHLADNRWQHIVHVYTGVDNLTHQPNVQTYINGTLETMTYHGGRNKNSTVKTTTENDQSVPLRIFDHLWKNKQESYEITPSVDELYIFKGALSHQQILHLYRDNRLIKQ